MILKYLNCDTCSNILFAALCPDFDLHSSHETPTYTSDKGQVVVLRLKGWAWGLATPHHKKEACYKTTEIPSNEK
jgi:hypothetical protein